MSRDSGSLSGCVEENRVRADRSGFYVKWVKEFTGFLPGKRLKQRSGKDIQAFLADLAGREGVTDWQCGRPSMH